MGWDGIELCLDCWQAVALADLVGTLGGMAAGEDAGVMVAAFAASVALAGGATLRHRQLAFLPESRIFFLKLIVFLSVANLLAAGACVIAFDWRLGTAPCAAVNATLPSPSSRRALRPCYARCRRCC